MKPLLPNSRQDRNENIILIENEQVINQPKTVAEILNDYVVNVTIAVVT